MATYTPAKPFIAMLLLLLFTSNQHALRLMSGHNTEARSQNLHDAELSTLVDLLPSSDDYLTDGGGDAVEAGEWNYLQDVDAPYGGLSETFQFEADLLRLQKWRQTKQQQQQRQQLWLQKMLEQYLKKPQQQLNGVQQQQQMPIKQQKQQQQQPPPQRKQQQQHIIARPTTPKPLQSEIHSQQSTLDLFNEHYLVGEEVSVDKPDRAHTVPQISEYKFSFSIN